MDIEVYSKEVAGLGRAVPRSVVRMVLKVVKYCRF